MKNPSLYQINTRVLLQEQSVALGQPATLDDIPEAVLDEIASLGFEWVWFLGVWQTGKVGREISRTRPELRAACLETLPDATDADICGSPFAIQSYSVHQDFGGNQALARLRGRLARRNLRLLLDFVPNHMAPDHPWVQSHPEYFIPGTTEDLAREPQNYIRLQTGQGEKILAHGRDPYFPGWPDTLQLNYRHPAAREAMMNELASVARRCDGVRCDMAMLVQPEVFQRTWGDRALPSDGAAPVNAAFWPEATRRIRQEHPDFLFIAEVYWDMEWELQHAGFDFTYDKRLYDRLRSGSARAVREHLMADPDFQTHSLRFLENHDEPRSAAVFQPMLQAAALITFFVPGMRFLYEGQLEGRKVHVSMHVGRRPREPVDAELHTFYRRVLQALKRSELREGHWQLWNCRPAWAGNGTWDQFIVFTWQQGDRRLLAVVNYGPARGQCYVTVELPGITGRSVALTDLFSDTRYDRDRLDENGLYLDMPPWGFHLFEMKERVARRMSTPRTEAVAA